MVTDAKEKTVIEAEEKLERANKDGDRGALEALLSDDFNYTGGNGGSQSKDEWLAGLADRRSGETVAKREADTNERAKQHNRGTVLLLTGLRVGESTGYEVEIHGDIGIANRCYSIQDPDGSDRCLRYVRVYRLEPGGPVLLSHRYIHAVD